MKEFFPERMVALSCDSSSVGRWISILYRYRQNYLSKRLDPFNIGSGQYFFLLVLSKNNSISQEGLSDFLKIDKATTAKAVKKLEEEGYVARDVDDMDKRAYRVYLTPKGWEILPIIEKNIRDWERLVTDGLSKEESRLLEGLLEKMARNACRIKEMDYSA
jgi:DNA-binding MarR family transcriptional regulator